MTRPNETLNQYYKISSEALASDCVAATIGEEEKCIPSWSWARTKMPWQYLINPVGKNLVRIFTTSYIGRRTRTKELISEIYQAREELSR